MGFRSVIKLCYTLFFVSCAAGPCKNEMMSKQPPLKENQKTPEQNMKEKEVPAFQRTYVYKFDGSLQCENNKPIPLVKMKEELDASGITVFESSNREGGFFMTQVCGAPTGRINRYQIAKSDLEKAIKLGFKEFLN